jgi:hypothetical protein
MKASGGCLCGAVRYEIDGEPVFAAHCYCRDCQKATGAGHNSALGMRREAVTVTGETRAYASTGDSGMPLTRNFCPKCGSMLFSEPTVLPGMMNITAGTLDDPSVFQPQLAIYVRSRPDWDRLAGDLTEFETVPPRPPPQG